MVTPAKFLLALLAGGAMLALLVGYVILRDDMVREKSTVSSPDGAEPVAASSAEDEPDTGEARLSGPTDCVRGPFRVRVSGSEISSVTFFVDGRQRRMVRADGDGGEFALRVDPREQSDRVHRVRADARFESATATRPESMRLTYQRCPQTASAVRFAG